MPNMKRYFHGDTLIEVTIAIGIFTLIAISVVAVVSVSTSGAQSALENTLTREEVDAQAEALRFIQSAYYEDNKNKENFGSQIVAQDYKDTKEDLYLAIWNKIVSIIENNNNVDDMENIVADDVLKFNPTSCNELYEDGENGKQLLKDQGAFILDLKKLGSYKEGEDVKQFAEDIVFNINDGDNDKLFIPASTYPQIEYDNNDNIKSVQGIYVVGVKDVAKTTIVSQDGEVVNIGTDSAYYDFYIRSCWYNSGSENLSKVSTSVRLRDPEAISYVIPPDQQVPDYGYEDEISFDYWRKYGDKKYDSHYRLYCPDGEGNGPKLSLSGTTYYATCEPVKNQHIITDGDDITLIGSTASATDFGVYYDRFNINAPFSIQVEIDASNVASHPNSGTDGLTISMDIVGWSDGPETEDEDYRGNQNIIASGVSALISSSTKVVSIGQERLTPNAAKFTLLLEYSRLGSNARFEACITEPGMNRRCISATKPIGEGKYLRVDYNSKSSAHGCNEIGVIKLFDVEMSHSTHGSITF